MSRTGNAIRQLKEALQETVNALDAVSEVLAEAEPFYFELFRQRAQWAELLDEDYVKNWNREQQANKDISDTVEMELRSVRQAMTDILNKLYLPDVCDD